MIDFNLKSTLISNRVLAAGKHVFDLDTTGFEREFLKDKKLVLG